ncbi:hypothetical protein ACWEOA_39230, partial [Streptomyces sp. NPDC004457]
LTSGPRDDRGVQADDGRRVAFASERGGHAVRRDSYSVRTVDVRTGELTRLTRDAGAEDRDRPGAPRRHGGLRPASRTPAGSTPAGGCAVDPCRPGHAVGP